MSNETKFTKGEWSVLSRNNNDIQTTFIGVKIAGEYLEIGFWNNSQHKANAHLISAAPDMYEALEQAVASMQDSGYPNSSLAVIAARKALAKARGDHQ